MSKFLKAVVVAAGLVAAASSISTASADATRMSCQAGQITPHGVWDCR